MSAARSFSTLILVTCFFFVATACTRGSTTAGGVHASTPGGSNGSGAGNMDGTYAGGGGNGLNGSTIESYQQDISVRPEFKMYIVPILERMAQTSPDVFVGYLNWVIHHKAWYFVPVSLPNLPKDKTALAFPSDQLALHSESEIYIDANAYNAKPHKDQAYLLLHEMVMGARLLMKHSPRTQCLALNADKDSNSCDSPDLLKLAVAPPTTTDDKPTLTGSDDEAVRSMTVFLLAHNQDYSGPNVRSFRLGLGFNYPWDRVVSNATLDTVERAMLRAQAADDRFSEFTGDNDTKQNCLIQLANRNGAEFQLEIYMPNLKGDPSVVNAGIVTEDSLTTSTGVLDPRGGTDVVDHLHSEPEHGQPVTTSAGDGSTPPLSGGYYMYDFYISRKKGDSTEEDAPCMIRFDITHVRFIPGEDGAEEVVPVRSSPIISCRVKD